MLKYSFFCFPSPTQRLSIHCRTYNPFHAQQKKRANKTDGGRSASGEQGTRVEHDDNDNVHGKGGGGRKYSSGVG
jgi:hypothetical protein